MTYSAIYDLIANHVSSVSGLPTLQRENTRNIGQVGVPFSRLTILPSRARPFTVGLFGRDLITGLAQIDLFRPLDEGVAASNALADLVIGHFPRGTVLTDGTTTVNVQVAWREAGTRVESFYNCPVVLQWTSLT